MKEEGALEQRPRVLFEGTVSRDTEVETRRLAGHRIG